MILAIMSRLVPHTVIQALIAQAGGLASAVMLLAIGLLPASPFAFVAVQAFAAAGLALVLHSPWWWIPIHLAFAPLALMTLQLRLPPGSFLAVFAALLFIYWNSFRSRVPLYLSNPATAKALGAFLSTRPGLRVLDIGSGTGALLRPLAKMLPHAQLTGIESAPLPYLFSRMLARGQHNLLFRRQDFYRSSWANYDCIYAFLSPAPMARVWTKACAEMPVDAWLISNSFTVPGCEPVARIDVGDTRGTVLYVYQPGRQSKAPSCE